MGWHTGRCLHFICPFAPVNPLLPLVNQKHRAMNRTDETLGFRIPKDLKKELRAYAESTGQSLSQLSRELLYLAIKKTELLITKNI